MSSSAARIRASRCAPIDRDRDVPHAVLHRTCATQSNRGVTALQSCIRGEVRPVAPIGARDLPGEGESRVCPNPLHPLGASPPGPLSTWTVERGNVDAARRGRARETFSAGARPPPGGATTRVAPTTVNAARAGPARPQEFFACPTSPPGLLSTWTVERRDVGAARRGRPQEFFYRRPASARRGDHKGRPYDRERDAPGSARPQEFFCRRPATARRGDHKGRPYDRERGRGPRKIFFPPNIPPLPPGEGIRPGERGPEAGSGRSPTGAGYCPCAPRS